MRILHAPLNLAGQAFGLSSKEEVILGHEGMSESLDIHPSRTNATADIVCDLRDASFMGKRLRLLQWVPKALFQYDVFHFYFGWSFFQWPGKYQWMNMWDLYLYRIIGKKIFMTFQGCDARIKTEVANKYAISICGQNSCFRSGCNEQTDRFKRNMITRVSRLCHKVFCLNPDLVPLVPRSEFLPYLSVDVDKIAPRQILKSNKMKIVHAPTDRAMKGTDIILRVVSDLRKRYDFDFVLVENKPHGEAVKLYQEADLAIDQVLAGWYGAFAVEMMAMGIPVIAYIRKEDLRYIPRRMAEEIPVVSAEPDTLKTVLENILKNPDCLHAIGKESREYVEKWHNPVTMAKRMLEIYRDPSQKFWDKVDEICAG